MKHGDSQRRMELDVYIPEKRLAFEYHGEQHYYDIYALGNAWSQRERDSEKRRACSEKGITLIEIPFWWDRDKSSLVATIHERRADLIGETGAKPIPTESPLAFPQGIHTEFL